MSGYVEEELNVLAALHVRKPEEQNVGVRVEEELNVLAEIAALQLPRLDKCI